MKITAKIVLVVALVVSSVAAAKWVGRFFCSTCSFAPGNATGSTYEFIWTEINQVVSSWVDADGQPNTFTICNGSRCANYKYIKLSGQWLYTGYYYSNWNPGASGGASGGGSGGSSNPIVTVGEPTNPDDDDTADQ